MIGVTCMHYFKGIIFGEKGEACFAFILLNALIHRFSFVFMKEQTSLEARYWLTTLQNNTKIQKDNSKHVRSHDTHAFTHTDTSQSRYTFSVLQASNAGLKTV